MTTATNLHRLVKLGLTTQEANIYLWLLEHGPARPASVAKALKLLTPAVYRSVHSLSRKGFLSLSGRRPYWLEPIPPEIVLPAFVKKQALVMNQLAQELSLFLAPKTKIKDPTQVEVIYGKEKNHYFAAQLARESQKEILAISIGEPIPPDLLVAIRKAVLRGIRMKLIVHKYDDENKELLENYVKNGMEIRYYPDWGFHLAVFDKKKVLLSVNDPENTRRRISIFFHSRGLAKAMRDYFLTVWKKAEEIPTPS